MTFWSLLGLLGFRGCRERMSSSISPALGGCLVRLSGARPRLEALGAAVGAEPVVVAVVREVGWRVGGLDLHAAHRIGRVAGAATEPFAVAVQPVEVAGEAEERDVEERRVVPVEAGLDDVARAVARDEPRGVEEHLDGEAGDRHDTQNHTSRRSVSRVP